MPCFSLTVISSNFYLQESFRPKIEVLDDSDGEEGNELPQFSPKTSASTVSCQRPLIEEVVTLDEIHLESRNEESAKFLNDLETITDFSMAKSGGLGISQTGIEHAGVLDVDQVKKLADLVHKADEGSTQATVDGMGDLD